MATKRGPTKGSRVLVELPFGKTVKGKNGKGGKSKLIMLKQGVAKELGFKPVTTLPVQTVTMKTAAGSRTVKRLSQGSYRRKSVKLIFESPKTIAGSTGSYKTVSLPMPSGVTLNDIVQYFHKGAGKSKGVIALISPDGKRIQWAFDDTKAGA